MSGSKFSAEVPKGDGWGVDEEVMDAVRQIQKGSKSPMIPVMGVVDIKEIKVDPETGNVTPVIRIRRLEALTTVDQIRTAQRLIMERWADRKGEGAVLPFEADDVLQRAFEGSAQPVGEALQDDEEKQIDAELDEAGRRRRHMIAVHDMDPNWALDADISQADVEREHDRQHDQDPDDRTWPDHDSESTVWRRVDMADMLGAAEEPTETDQELHDGDLRRTDSGQLQEYGDGEWVDVDEPPADPSGQGLIPEFRPESDGK